ncbi:MAG: transglutaminase [Brevundimonas sp.]|nr:transglutaminase [Brevundimonas sp.]
MDIRCGYRIGYSCPEPVAMVLMLSLRQERLADLVTRQFMMTTPAVPLRDYIDDFGNVCTRLVAPAGNITFSADFIVRDSGLPDPVVRGAVQHPIDDLPEGALIYLLGSRYCETNRLNDIAWALFGGIEPGWARVQAIVDYVHDRIEFGYHHARPTKTAFDAHEEGCGVCRDFAHLAITLCRCVNIPARYCTGYLGDIGIPPIDAPMDFSAWFQAYLGGEWRTFDARHNRPRIGRVLMAHGRDATDTAITTTFGPNQLTEFTVITEEVPAFQ